MKVNPVISLAILVSACVAQGQAEFVDGVTTPEASELVRIRVDASEALGKINKDLSGFHVGPTGHNEYWIPVLRVFLGWGGDVWFKYNTWPAEGEYHWKTLDATIERLRAKGCRVTLSISLVPEWLWSPAPDNHQATSRTFPYLKKGHTRPPYDYRKWEKLVFDTVRHLNGDDRSKGEKNYGVSLQIWNEPNVSWFWSGTRAQCLEMYERTARTIRKADRDTIIGGLGVADFDRDWIAAFVEHCAARKVPVDFVAWHYYLYHDLKANQPTSHTEQIEFVRGLIGKNRGIGNPALYNTEWAYYWKAKDFPNPNFQAAYNAQSMYEMTDSGLDQAFYCATLKGFHAPEPGVNVFAMFNRLAESRVEAVNEEKDSTVGVLASKDDGRIAILVWDYPLQQRQTHNRVSVRVDNCVPGNHTYRRFVVDTKHVAKTPVEVESRALHVAVATELTFDLEACAVTLIELTEGLR